MADFSQGGRRRHVVLLMVLIAITLATLDSRSGDSGPIGVAGRVAHKVVQPISNAASSVLSPFHDWWQGLTNHGDLVKQNRRLKGELQQAHANMRDGENAKRQNAAFNDVYRFPFQKDYPSVGARVVPSANPGNLLDEVTLNVGSEQGIARGMAVVGPEGLIGRIQRIWDGGSTVLLISDASFGVAVRPLLSTQTSEASTGDDGRLDFVFEDNPKQTDSTVRAREGDTIITCGCPHSEFPLGIPVGTVAQSIRSADRSQVSVVLRSFLDRASLDFVRVLKWRRGDATPPNVSAAVAVPTTKAPK